VTYACRSSDQNDTNSVTNEDDADDDVSLKLVSAKDFFDDEV